MPESSLTLSRRLAAVACLAAVLPCPALSAVSPGGWNVEFKRGDWQGIDRLISPTGAMVFASGGGRGLLSAGLSGARAGSYKLQWLNAAECRVRVETFRTAGGELLPVALDLAFRFQDEEIACTATLTVSEPVRFDGGFSLDIPLDGQLRLDFTGAPGDTFSAPLIGTLSPHQRYPFQNLIRVLTRRAMLFVLLRQPLYPVVRQTPDALKLEMLAACPPNTTQPAGLNPLASTLQPGDTVRAEFSILCGEGALGRPDRPPLALAAFSPHPYAAEQSICLAFDHIPSPEFTWSPPTDDKDPHLPVTSNLLSYLVRYPDVKFTWLVVTDDIERLGKWFWQGWWPPSDGVVPESVTVRSGGFAVRLSLDDYAAGSSVLGALVPVDPGRDYHLEFHAYLDPAPPGDASLIADVLDWPYNNPLASTRSELAKGAWTKNTLDFNAGTAGVAYLRFVSRGKGPDIILDDVTLSPKGGSRNFLPNPGFESFRPFIEYEPDEPIWPNARGFWRILDLPRRFHTWLRDLADGTSIWRFRAQVGLGLHGLHHTPDSGFVRWPQSPQHEFDRFDPEGDSLRFARIAEDLTKMQINPDRMFAFFRFPGHRHTESALKPLLEHRVRVFDHGIFPAPDCYFMRIFGQGRWCWMTNSLAWFDQPSSDQLDHLMTALSRGQFALTGVHYFFFGSLTTPGNPEFADSVLKALHGNFPHLHWFTGDELAQFWDELGALSDFRQEGYEDNLTLTWNGAAHLGQTVIVYLGKSGALPARCLVDDSPVTWTKRGDRLFVILPRLEVGKHRLTVQFFSAPVLKPPETSWMITMPARSLVRIDRNSGPTTNLSARLVDLQGRYVHAWRSISLPAGAQSCLLSLPPLPPGTYLLRITAGEETLVRSLTLTN